MSLLRSFTTSSTLTRCTRRLVPSVANSVAARVIVGQRLARNGVAAAGAVTAPNATPRVSSSFSTSAASSDVPPPYKSGTIPVIDLTGTFGSGPDVESRQRLVASEIDRACRDIGFFTIIGHGIPTEQIDAVWSTTQSYFDLSDTEKNLIPMNLTYPYGYSGFGGESLSKGYGEDGRPDPKECFAIGPNNPKAGMPAVRWPQQPQQFQKEWQQYYSSMEKLSSHILSLFALALNLPKNWFEDKIDRHRSALRALNYPKLPVALKAGEVRAGAHTDYGSLTVLLQDSVGGLQVRNRSGEWVDAVPRPNSFVINLGDLMQRWTNTRWISTLHRVVQPPSAAAAPPARRQSMAFFFNVNPDTIIECISTCTSEKEPPKFKPAAAWDLLMEKHNSATTTNN